MTDCFTGVDEIELEDVWLVDFDEALAERTIQYILDECLGAFVDAVSEPRPGGGLCG